MLKTKTTVDIKVQLELTRKNKITSIIMLIIGIIGLTAYIVLGTIWEDKLWVEMFLFFAIPFSVGIVVLVGINKTNKRILNNKSINENEFEFHENHVDVVTIRDGEIIGNAKLFYKDLHNVKETKNYVFIFISNVAALPIDKNNLSQNQLIILRGLLKLPLNG